MIVVALGQLAAAEAPHHGASHHPASTPSPQQPQRGAKPSDAAPIHGDTQRLAAALEAQNRYQQSTAAQADAHKAAEAAHDAAYWAKWLFFAGVAETLITAFGVGLVGLTLNEARRSANEAQRAADAMVLSADSTREAAWGTGVAARNSAQANAHARDRANAELRAYVFVYLTEIERETQRFLSAQGPAKRKVTSGRVSYRYRNTGKTPARNVRVAARAIIIATGERLDLATFGEMRPVGPMGPKDSLGDDVPIDGLIHGQDAQAHVKDGKEIHLFGRIEYDTDFAKDRWTTFHSYVGGDVAWERTLHTAKTGNDFD